MKRLIIFLIVIALIIVTATMIGCDNKSPKNPFEPPANQTADPTVWTPFVPQAELSLMKVGQDGELPKISVGEDINFGEILATKKMSYIVMNSGNLDLFDIQFTANNLEIFPGTIGTLRLPEGGLSTSPIVSFTIPHVIPSSGVGSLLDMEIGPFIDTVVLSFNYEIIPFDHAVLNETEIVALMDSIIAVNDSTNDTLWVYGDTLLTADVEMDTISTQKEYSVGGTRMGAIIKILVSGENLENYSHPKQFNSMPGYSQQFISIPSIESALLDTTLVTNQGNAPLQIRIQSCLHQYEILNYNLLPNDTINISGLWRGQDFVTDSLSGEILIFGNVHNQPYLYTLLDEIWINGSCAILISEVPFDSL